MQAEKGLEWITRLGRACMAQSASVAAYVRLVKVRELAACSACHVPRQSPHKHEAYPHWKWKMKQLNRITLDPTVMGGKACIRGMRVTVGMVLGLLAAGRTLEEILKAYPYLEPDDIGQALAYAAWRVEEREVPLAVA